MKNIILLIAISFSTIALADINYQCEGAFNIISLSKNQIFLYKKVGIRTHPGEIILPQEIGKPVPYSMRVDGLRQVFKGAGIEFIVKDGQGILTKSPSTEIKEKNFFCREFNPPSDRSTYRPKPVCRPGNCR